MEDIEKLLDTVEGDPKVTRRIRSEMDKEEEEVVPAAQAAAGKGAAAEEEEGTRHSSCNYVASSVGFATACWHSEICFHR